MTTETKTVRKSLVPYLRVPEDGSEPYLTGAKCKSCGEVFLIAPTRCPKCISEAGFDELRLSGEGELYVFSIVHQSAPNVPVPYIPAVVDLAEGVAIKATIVGVEPKPENLHKGMKLRMVTEKLGTDRSGAEVYAYKFIPALD